MEIYRIHELVPGTPIWVWIVRVGKGRWWAGSVLSITSLESFPIVDTRFEYRSTGRNGIDGPACIGISTTRMRYLELRDPDLKCCDRPDFVPSAIFPKTEESGSLLNGIEHPGTISTAAVAARSRAASVKKPRPRRKTKARNPIQEAIVLAIET